MKLNLLCEYKTHLDRGLEWMGMTETSFYRECCDRGICRDIVIQDVRRMWGRDVLLGGQWPLDQCVARF